jgi:hypothetical protein
MPEVLILANETIGGQALLDAIKERAQQGDSPGFHVCVPTIRPPYGNVIYDDAVRDSAQVRVDLALSFMEQEGIRGTGEVGDQDPFNAATDALAVHPCDEIIVSTLPPTESKWLRRDLIGKLQADTGLPVRHVIVDLARDGLPFDVTLVVANQTAAGGELEERLKALASEGPRRFIAVVPQDSGDGTACIAATGRLKQLIADLRDVGIVAAGMIGHPDPYTAVLNAVAYFHISDIVISTLPSNRSEWLKNDLPEKVRSATGKEVVHVESTADEPAGAEA